MREQTSNVAIYWDFENLQASLVEKKGGNGAYGRTKYQAQEALIDIESVMEYAATFGVVSINRAYCNWQWYGKYREQLLHNGLELIQLFHPGASAKNGGDIKLCLDCTEDLLRFPHIDVVVIVGGDSDYLPLVQKIKAQGKVLVGIGVQANTNRHWAHSCHEFKFYEALSLEDESTLAPPIPPAPAQIVANAPSPIPGTVATPTNTPPSQPLDRSNSQNHRPNADSDNFVQTRPEELLRRAILRLAGKSGDAWVLKGAIRPMMKRLDPTFEEEQHGVKTFSSFMKKFESMLDVRAGRNDQEVRLKDKIRPIPLAELQPEAPRERHPDRHGEHRRDRDRQRLREQPAPEESPAPPAGMAALDSTPMPDAPETPEPDSVNSVGAPAPGPGETGLSDPAPADAPEERPAEVDSRPREKVATKGGRKRASEDKAPRAPTKKARASGKPKGA